MATFTCNYNIRDLVQIDGQSDIIGRITAITFRVANDTPYALYQVDWLHNGTNYTHSIEDWRLLKVGEV